MAWLLALLLSTFVGGPNSDCMIVEFTIDNCGPCKQLQPALEKLKGEGWVVRTVDAEREPLLVRKFAVESLPTLVLISHGKEVDRIVGAAPYEKILPRLAKLLLANAAQPSAIAPAAKSTASTTPSGFSNPASQFNQLGSTAPNSPRPTANESVVQPNNNFANSNLASGELTVRGQSPSSGAFPMLAAASTALSAPANASSLKEKFEKFDALQSSNSAAASNSMAAAHTSSASLTATQDLPRGFESASTPALLPSSQPSASQLSTSQPSTAPLNAPRERMNERMSQPQLQAKSAAAKNPPLSIQQAVARAQAATVRIRVDEENATAYGTGTIIDVHDDEALVLTCGHLFREMKPHSQLTIDLFAGRSEPINIPAQLIDFQATPGQEDIGLISFRLPFAIEPVPLLPKSEALSVGQTAFSFGCDHGDNPTRRDTQIKSINRYMGAPNVEISGAPAVGRSGGGLFDTQGRLIGVCNAADATDDEGIYAAAALVYQQIDRLGLSHLFSDEETSSQVQLASHANPLPNTQNVSQAAQPFASQPSTSTSQLNPAQGILAQGNAEPAQLTCIMRGADGREQVVTVPAPSPELLDAIHRQARR